MPTTYTSLLGLALPATGELSGTWGSTVNTEITSLLDTAVAGTTTLSTDADVTLSTTTGAANQARQAIILWTANGTVTRNITAPAASKTYVVINASAGTQSIVFRGVGPTAGVTVVKGESAVVAWNGSDFIKVSNTSGAGAFTNLSVSGTTTLSGLTASTALALDASKNVVSVTNTGTGNNVLATSPVLTTPNLGTPSAITLTNATGLPVSTGISGLGTGVATALAVNTGAAGAFVVNGGALGTPSSGTVTNLTGTASININGTVGATTPNTGAFTTLSASGVATFSAGTAAAPALTTTGDLDTGVWFPAANTWAVATGASERMRITSAGDVGIGTTSPGARLHVSGSSSQYILAQSTDTTGTAIGYVGAQFGSSTVLQMRAGLGYTYLVSTGTTDPLLFGTNNQERMRITSGGLVGIGTAFPSLRLTVVDANDQLSINNATNELIVRANSTEAALYTFQAIPLNFYTNNQERMRITSGGDVGIGTTSPAYRLDVANGFSRIGAFNTQSFPSSNSSGGAAFGWNRSNGSAEVNITNVFDNAALSFEFAQKTGASTANVLYSFGNSNHLWYTGGFERMRISSGGDVGIGTSAPGRMLTVSSSSDTSIQSISSGANSYIQATGSAGSVYFGAISTAFGVLAGGSERMRIKDTGQTRFVPLAADPAGAESGDVYYNSGTNKLRVYNGTAWVDLH